MIVCSDAEFWSDVVVATQPVGASWQDWTLSARICTGVFFSNCAYAAVTAIYFGTLSLLAWYDVATATDGSIHWLDFLPAKLKRLVKQLGSNLEKKAKNRARVQKEKERRKKVPVDWKRAGVIEMAPIMGTKSDTLVPNEELPLTSGGRAKPLVGCTRVKAGAGAVCVWCTECICILGDIMAAVCQLILKYEEIIDAMDEAHAEAEDADGAEAMAQEQEQEQELLAEDENSNADTQEEEEEDDDDDGDNDDDDEGGEDEEDEDDEEPLCSEFPPPGTAQLERTTRNAKSSFVNARADLVKDLTVDAAMEVKVPTKDDDTGLSMEIEMKVPTDISMAAGAAAASHWHENYTMGNLRYDIYCGVVKVDGHRFTFQNQKTIKKKKAKAERKEENEKKQKCKAEYARLPASKKFSKGLQSCKTWIHIWLKERAAQPAGVRLAKFILRSTVAMVVFDVADIAITLSFDAESKSAVLSALFSAASTAYGLFGRKRDLKVPHMFFALRLTTCVCRP